MITVSHRGEYLFFNTQQELDAWVQEQWLISINSWSKADRDVIAKREADDKARRQARKDAILRGELPRRIRIKSSIECDDPVLTDEDLV